MKLTKIVIDLIIVFFIVTGTYFKWTDKIANGYMPMGGRRGNGHGFQQSVISWYSLFFFAFVFIVFRIGIVITEMKAKKKRN